MTLEARFIWAGQSTTPPQSQPQQPSLTVINNVSGDYTVTIPANTTVYGYSSPTSTSRLTLYSPKSASFTLSCTQQLTMSDGTTRYFFRSGGTTAQNYYLMFTSAMRVEERVASTPALTPSPTPTLVPDVDMSNIGNTTGNLSNGGLAAISDGWIYYRNTNDRGSIYAMRTDGSDRRKVNDDSSDYINVVGDRIYYRNIGDWLSIYSIKTDGSDRNKLCDDEWTQYISVVDGWIYYRNGNRYGGTIYKIGIDGSGRQQLNDDSSSYVTISGDRIFYRNESDGYKLYSIKTDGSNKQKLNDDQTSCINVVGDMIYYLSTPSFYSGDTLYSMKTDGTKRTNLSDRFANSFLSGGTYFAHINVIGNTIYCFNRSSSYWGVLYRMDIDGSNGATVYSAGGGSVNVVGDRIFYYNSDQNVRTVKIDGSDWQRVE